MSLDFTSARLKHSAWKLKLRDFLDGKPGLTEAQATSSRDCDLGKWIYGDGQSKYGAIPEMKQLETEHARLHEMIKTIMVSKRQGQAEKAEAEYKKIEPLSKTIVSLLDTMEKKVDSKAA
ncbi:MAG: CZB domain-containing protein [Candidatus Eisenbacteria bacterium]|uniref:CZB domain-containing protein n=1 Tax=Eiseniibacteriota bacterium TaxID=2212470 RepID=A0A956LXT5_UNCEI|nr:CZB domain-containing protein [Candidatus Eisenbacteria bacterium]